VRIVTNMSKVCKGCWKWEEYKKKCHIYWEDKSVCTKWQYSPSSPEQYVGQEIQGVGL
jgi:hypothetical protein